MKRKILAIMLGFVLMLGTFAGCTVQDENENEQYKDRDITQPFSSRRYLLQCLPGIDI